MPAGHISNAYMSSRTLQFLLNVILDIPLRLDSYRQLI